VRDSIRHGPGHGWPEQEELNKADGETSVRACVLLCFFHHQVVIHRWGWTLVLNRDGTTMASNKDKSKVLHSHGPPARPG
jgi:hypothetical protein